MDQDSEIEYQREARSANEQQDTPSNNACSKKNQIVLFRPIQHSAQYLVTPSVNSRSQTDVTQLISKHLAFQTERLGREVRSGFGSFIATLFE